MSPLKWLRVVRRRKPATGGYVATPAPIVLEGCHRWPADMGTPPAPPDGVTIRMHGYTEMTDEERREFLDAVRAVMGRSAA